MKQLEEKITQFKEIKENEDTETNKLVEIISKSLS